MTDHLDPSLQAALLTIAALDWQLDPPPSPVAESQFAQFGRYVGLPPKLAMLADGRKAQVLEPISYVDAMELNWDVPAGAEVDGASIPRAFWSLIGGPFEGKYRDASIVHDIYCDSRERAWLATHRMFHEAMRCSGVSPPKAKIMYYAVYRFGPRWANPGEPVAEGMAAQPAPPGAAQAASIAADAEAIYMHGLSLDEVERLADIRNAAEAAQGLAPEAGLEAAISARSIALLVVPGGRGDAADVAAVAHEASLLPDFVGALFERKKARIIACRGAITDFEASLRGQIPRGWEGTGHTWDDVPGVYLPERKRVVIATQAGVGGARVVPTQASGLHGSSSLLVHESLHGYDYLSGHAVLHEPRFQTARDRDLQEASHALPVTLRSYLGQQGQPGLEETFAESGALFVADAGLLADACPHLFAYWNSEPIVAEAIGLASEAPDLDAPIGTAEFLADGVIRLDLRAIGPGMAIGHAVLDFSPEDGEVHARLAAHLSATPAVETPEGPRVPFRPMPTVGPSR